MEEATAARTYPDKRPVRLRRHKEHLLHILYKAKYIEIVPVVRKCLSNWFALLHLHIYKGLKYRQRRK